MEGLDNQRLHEFAVLCSPSAPSLIVTQQRARAIGIEASVPMTLLLSEATGAGDIVVPSADREARFTAKAKAAGCAAGAAIRLIKLSRSMPAVLAANMTNIDSSLMHSHRRR